MAKYEIIKDAGIALGLLSRPNEATVIGLKEGYPVQILTRKKGNNIVLSGVVRYDEPSMDSLIKDSLSKMPELKQAGIRKKSLEVSNGMLFLNVIKGITGFPKVEEFAKKMEVIIHALKSIVSPPGLKCRICGRTSVDNPILINGIVDLVCPGCIEKLEAETRDRQTSYDTLPINIPLTLLVASLLCIVGAAAYGGMIIVTNRMFWIIAIGIGILIAKGAGKAAGRMGIQIQIISGLFTVISVLLGLAFCAGYILHKHALTEGYNVDWSAFLKNLPMILVSMKTDALFSLGGGLIGAYYATRYTRKPVIKLKVEK